MTLASFDPLLQRRYPSLFQYYDVPWYPGSLLNLSRAHRVWYKKCVLDDDKKNPEEWLARAVSLCLYNLFWIMAANDAFDGSIYRLRGLYSTIAIDKNKSFHTINLRITSPLFILFFLHHLKCIIDHIKHWDCTNTCFGFRLWDLQGWCSGVPYGIINDTVIDTDLTITAARNPFSLQEQHPHRWLLHLRL